MPIIYSQVKATEQQAPKAEMKRTTEPKWYRRLKVVNLSSQGCSVPTSTALFDLSEVTIRLYIQNCNEGEMSEMWPKDLVWHVQLSPP